MKKVLCLVMAFMMLLPVCASAAEGFKAVEIAYENGAVDKASVEAMEENAKVILAAYDEAGKLLAVGSADSEFPAETKLVKAYAFEGEAAEEIKEEVKEEVKEVGVGGFANGNENPEDTWVVGIVGASTVQAGQYSAFLYQYYATRHPGKNIVIVNKGSAGCTAWDVFKRLNWDIFNEDDPLGYGACDEIAIMVGANDISYGMYTDGKMDDDQYEVFYNGKNRFQNDPEKLGKLVTNMTSKVEESFTSYKRIVKWCKENGKKVTFTPMTLYDESDAFESTLSHGVCYGANHALGMLSDRLEKHAAEEGVIFVDTWGLSNEYSERIRKEYPGTKTVITGTDGLHHSGTGGYLVGYIIANQQEKDDTVALVEIDANAKTSTTETAKVKDLKATSNSVSYTYLPEALPLYAKAPGYIFAEEHGVDITNTMNKEIIKVTGLDEGTYTIKMDGNPVAEFTAAQLAEGVNIATYENNPGQVQSKALHDNYYEKRRMLEAEYRSIGNEELRLRNVNLSNFSVHYDDPSYKEFTAQDWIDLCNKFVAEGMGTLNADIYPERKLKQATYEDDIRKCIEGMAKDSIPAEHKVVIAKK